MCVPTAPPSKDTAFRPCCPPPQLLAHVIFIMELGTGGLYAGVTLSAAAFGSTWPLTVRPTHRCRFCRFCCALCVPLPFDLEAGLRRADSSVLSPTAQDDLGQTVEEHTRHRCRFCCASTAVPSSKTVPRPHPVETMPMPYLINNIRLFSPTHCRLSQKGRASPCGRPRISGRHHLGAVGLQEPR